MLQSARQVLDIIPAPITTLVGIALLLGGGHWLVEGSVTLARRLGVSTLLIGLTVVAFGTSAPELAFNITAAGNGNGDLAFGNLFGSNIANIAMVLGLTAIFMPIEVHSRVFRKELPFVVAVTAGAILLAWLPATRLVEGDTARPAFTRPDGVILVSGFAFATWFWYRAGRRDQADALATGAETQVATERPESMPVAMGLFAVGLAALVAGGKLTEAGAVAMAERLGLSQSIVGLTVVAIATSLPELIASVMAVRKGHPDIAVGNVLGSNLFNMLLVLGTTSLVAPVPVAAGRGWWDLAVTLALTLALFPIARRNQRRILRLEGSLLFACYVTYLTWSVWREM